MNNNNNFVENFPGSRTLDEIDVEYYDRVFLDFPNIHITDDDLRADDVDALIRRFIKNSIGAATAQGAANTKVRAALQPYYRSKKADLAIYLEGVFNSVNVTTGKGLTYREWHTQKCRDMIAMFSSITDNNFNQVWTFGNSQKVLNLGVKYFVVSARRLAALHINNRIKQIGDIFISIIEEVDIPVDSLIEEASWNYNLTHIGGLQLELPYLRQLNGEFKEYKVKAWSNWDENDYITYVKSLHRVFTVPLNWEGYAWTEVKRARAARNN